MSSALSQLKSELQANGLKLIEAENLKSSRGVGTGWSALDSFVASGGFPCGELSLIESAEGLGALTLWLEAAALLTKNASRVAWLNSSLDDREPFQLHPPAAARRGVDLQKLFLVDASVANVAKVGSPATDASKKRLWILQELLSSNLFSLVGCDLGDVRIPLRECRSLLMQARRSGAAVVLFDRRSTLNRRSSSSSSFGSSARSLASLVLKFELSQVEIVRASHRPVPQHLTRRDRNVDFITANRALALDSSLILASAEDDVENTIGASGSNSRFDD